MGRKRIGQPVEAMIRGEAWESLPGIMVGLLGHFADIKITKLTRDASEWQGAYQRLLDEWSAVEDARSIKVVLDPG